jgi:site-specific DNA-cytosine methylase
MNAPTVGGLGIGLLAYGLTLAGWRHEWLCEVDAWRREVLGIRYPGVTIVGDCRGVAQTADTTRGRH